MKISLQDKTVLITGATGDLGRVMTRSLAACGADVAIQYQSNESKAKELAEEVRSLGQKAGIFQADITDPSSVNTLRDQVFSSLGAPDVVIANAVIQIAPWKSVLEEDPAKYDSQFRSCVMQSVYLAKAFLPAMIGKKHGRFIGINTECALECRADSSAYVSGKRGMDGLYRVLAKEVGNHQITVNQIAPGWMISDRDRLKGTSENLEYQRDVPMSRRGSDQDIANVAAFLASDLANFITGVLIPVCGGRATCAI